MTNKDNCMHRIEKNKAFGKTETVAIVKKQPPKQKLKRIHEKINVHL